MACYLMCCDLVLVKYALYSVSDIILDIECKIHPKCNTAHNVKKLVTENFSVNCRHCVSQE